MTIRIDLGKDKITAVLTFTIKHGEERSPIHTFHGINAQDIEDGRGKVYSGDNMFRVMGTRLQLTPASGQSTVLWSSAAKHWSLQKVPQCHDLT